MKKLIIAAAIVCAAAISHGASLLWGISAVTQTETTSLVSGAVGYFMDASTWTNFSAAEADQKATYCANNYKYTGTITVGRNTGISVTSGTYQTGDTISGYIVIFDKAAGTTPGYYANTAVTTVTAPGTGNAQILPTFADGTAGWIATSGPEPTPEPTSALLMLLGVAGLALKRKQK